MVDYHEGGDLDVVMTTCEQAGPIDEAVLRASQIISSPNTLQIDDECLGYSESRSTTLQT